MTIIYGQGAVVLPGATMPGIQALTEQMHYAIKRHEDAGRPQSRGGN